jgi:hypothetical protein
MPTSDPTVPIKGKGSPGPGFYSPNSGFDKIGVDVQNMKSIQNQGLDKYGISLIRPSNSFASKVERFNQSKLAKRKEVSPEPGTYEIKNSWDAKGTIKMGVSHSHKTMKSPYQPPSIPSHDFVFGYEFKKG